MLMYRIVGHFECVHLPMFGHVNRKYLAKFKAFNQSISLGNIAEEIDVTSFHLLKRCV